MHDWSPPSGHDPKLGTLDSIACGAHGGTQLRNTWLPAAVGHKLPHLPAFLHLRLLGFREFERPNAVQGLLRFELPVYQHMIFHDALVAAGVVMDPETDSHPACEFVLLNWTNSGEYLMGEGDTAREIQIEHPFLAARTPLVQAVWLYVAEHRAQQRSAINADPSHFKGSLRPVEQVSWFDCVEFCLRTGLRMPSESEWEFACRGGSTTAWCFGDDEALLPEWAWFYDNSSRETHPVALKRHNAFGLYDTHGNVWEWCADEWGEAEQIPSDGSAFGIDVRAAFAVRAERPEVEQGSDPSTPARPSASTGAAAGAAARPTAGRRSAAGARPAAATPSLASAPSEVEQGSDPSTPARPSASAGAAAGTSSRPSSGRRTASGSRPASASPTSGSAPSEDEQGSDPSTLTPARPAASAGAAAGAAARPSAARRTAAGARPASAATTSGSAPSEVEQGSDPSTLTPARPTASTEAAAGTTPRPSAGRRYAAGTRQATATPASGSDPLDDPQEDEQSPDPSRSRYNPDARFLERGPV